MKLGWNPFVVFNFVVVVDSRKHCMHQRCRCHALRAMNDIKYYFLKGNNTVNIEQGNLVF